MVYKRQIQLPPDQSFFLFGPRGTGKTTLLETWQSEELDLPSGRILNLDLLDPEAEEKYSLDPGILKEELSTKKFTWCIIDEVQKNPALLDVAHFAIQKKLAHFALSGSSARKLKRGRGNLLAGRAFDFLLHPLTSRELGAEFDLMQALQFGTLPGVFEHQIEQDKNRFLQAYTRTYLKEEIQLEQLVRNVQRFRRFLAFAGQMNTKILNFSKLAASSGVDQKSVNRYFEILEDTLVGLLLEPYERSVRKRQSQKPKFYLFDTGVACHLREDLAGAPRPGTSAFGELFEQWFVLEVHRLRDYAESKDRFSYLRTKDDAEIDLIIERPGQHPMLIEIKSADRVGDDHVGALAKFAKSMKHSRAVIASRERVARTTASGVEVLPYEQVLRELYP